MTREEEREQAARNAHLDYNRYFKIKKSNARL